MIQRLLFAVLLTVLVYQHPASAQEKGQLEERYHRLGIKTGYSWLRTRDLTLSTFVYSGGGVPLQLEYNFQHPDFKMNLSAGFNIKDSVPLKNTTMNGFKYSGELGSFIDDTIGDLDHQTVNVRYVQFSSVFLGRLKFLHHEKWQIYLGGGISYYFLEKQFLSLEYTNYLEDRLLSFNLAASLGWNPGDRHQFQYVFHLPLLSRVSRQLSLESGTPDFYEYKKWTSLGSYFAVNNYFIYTFRFANRWSVEGTYQLMYLQCAFPRKEKLMMQSFTAGLNFHF
jgi:hypothetical protein